MVEDIDRLCADAGITLTALARSAGVSHGHLSRVLAGKASPTIELYAKLAIPLGADLSTRLYPNTGPMIRDRHQARILEALLHLRHPRWQPHTEVTVRQPARGWIDLVLYEPREHRLVATEIQSELRRLEQIVRWSREKADSLRSWSLWQVTDAASAELGRLPAIDQLLIVRRTRATQTVARDFARHLAIAFPAHPEDALAALMGTAPWPGSALIWARIDPKGVHFLPTR